MVRSSYCSQTGLKRGAWTPEEDRKLSAYITRYGHWNWRELPKFAGLERCGKSCRLRWMNYLRPNIKRGNYTIEEEEIIINLHKAVGNRWSAIAAKLPGRTDNEIKNHWHTHLKKRSQRSSREREEVKMRPLELSNYLRELQSILCVDSIRPSILESSSELWTPLQKNTCQVSSPSDSDSGASEVPITDGNIFNTFEELGGNFWNEPFQVSNSFGLDFTSILANLQLDFPPSPVYSMDVYSNHLMLAEDMQPLL